ncbi:MAG: sulfatase, partial [Opitutales bacterium]
MHLPRPLARPPFAFLLGLLGLPAGIFAEASSHDAVPDRPNILWIVSEDNSARWLGSYGNEQARTPHLDTLAAEGFRYTRTFADSPVCAPQRSTWITGMLSLSLGTHPMRSSYPVPEAIPVYPRALQEAGYFTHNAEKTDYNGIETGDAWDSSGDDPAPWRRAPAGQPWFAIINIFESHESRAFGDIEHTRHDPSKTDLAAYHPDLGVIRKNYALYHDRINNMDQLVGDSLRMLEEAGLAEDTIVIYNSDHGGVLPRSKRYLFESGLHTPLIIRIPEKFRPLWPAAEPGEAVEEIVSFHDIIPTILRLAGADVPDLMSGRNFLGPDRGEPRERHFAFRERMDERYDNARAVRGERYLYIRNYAPWAPWMQHLGYLWRMPATQAWEAHWQAGETSPISGRWFEPKMSAEELYDTVEDPDCTRNLAGDPAHAPRLAEMRAALREWQLQVHDTALLPEFDRAERAREHGLTIYEMVRDPALYDLPAYLDAADLATAADPRHLPHLLELMNDPDSGLRFWGTTGLLLLSLEDSL